MKFRCHWIVFLAVAVLFAGCATKKDFQRLEGKVDLLIQATKRSTLDELFGDQSSQIAQLVNDLDVKQKQDFENLQQEYARGTTSIEEARQKMLGSLVITTVSSAHGVESTSATRWATNSKPYPMIPKLLIVTSLTKQVFRLQFRKKMS